MKKTTGGLSGKRIIVGVTGGIAAYKAVELVRELQRRGAEVRVVMSPSATRFVGAITFTGITGRPAVVDLWDPNYAGEVHVELGEWADAIVVAPASMNALARAANGIADDVVLATISCARGSVVFAPAMHTRMWQGPATRRNVARLVEDGALFVGPVVGALASGEVGAGRMEEPKRIASFVERVLARPQERDWAGRRLLISAGPTYEDLDPVRFIGNRSSGKMGYALAEEAIERGAAVTVVRGPVGLDDIPGAEMVRVRSAKEMREAIVARAKAQDVVIMAAAVADYRPAFADAQKTKKSGDRVQVELVKNHDILAELGAQRKGKKPVLVGFAVETKNLVAYARKKLAEKRVDFIVANEARHGFEGDDNVAVLVDSKRAEKLGKMSKRELAGRILDRAKQELLR